MKKVGITIRQFWYDLNLVSYYDTMVVMNRFKRLDLVDRVPEELWMEVCSTGHEVVTKTILKKMKCMKAKWLSEKTCK